MSKAYADYTIADVIRLVPDWLREKQVKDTTTHSFGAQLGYLKTLIGMVPHVAAYYFIDVFGDYDISGLDNNAINKAIFEYVPKPRVPEVSFESKYGGVGRWAVPFKDVVESLKPDLGRIKQTLEDKEQSNTYLLSEIREYEEKIMRYRGVIAETFKSINVNRLMVEDLKTRLANPSEGLDPVKKKVIMAVPKQWIVVDVTKDHFTVVRRTPVVITHASISKTLNLGYCQMQMGWDMSMWTARPIADFIDFGDSGFYPHLSGGSICWGNQLVRAERLIDEGNYTEWWTLLESILTTYCGDNPYIVFDNLDKAKKDRWQALSPRIPTNTQMKWFTGDMRAMIIREWTKTASESFIKATPAMLAPVPQNTAAKRQKIILFLENFAKQVLKKKEEIKNHLLYDQFVWSRDVLTVFRDVGIRVPPRDIFFRGGISQAHVSNMSSALMLMAYGSFPILDGSGSKRHCRSNNGAWGLLGFGFNGSNNLRFFNTSDDVFRNYHEDEVKSGIINGYYASSVSLTTATLPLEEEMRKQEDAIRSAYSGADLTRHLAHLMTIQKHTANARPAAEPAPTAVTPTMETSAVNLHSTNDSFDSIDDDDECEHDFDSDDDDECEHDFDSDGDCMNCGHHDSSYCEHNEFDDDGNCTSCGYYDEEYDENREPEPEMEEAVEEAPF